MALNKQLVPISFSQGIDQRTDPKQVVAGKLSILENGTFNELMEIRKRNGFDPISSTIISGGSISSGTGVYSFQEEILRSTGTTLYGYSPTAGTNISRGGYVTNDVKFESVTTDVTDLCSPQVAYHNAGYKLVTWSKPQLAGNPDIGTYFQNYYKIIDIQDESIVVSGTLSVYGSVKLAAIGNYFIIVGTVIPNQTLPFTTQYQSINVVSSINSISSATTISGSVEAPYDCVVNNGNAYFVGLSDDASPNLIAYYISSSLVVSTPVDVTAATELSSYAGISADNSNQIWIAFWEDAMTRVQYRIYNSTLTSTVLGRTTVVTGTSTKEITLVCSGTSAHLFYDRITTNLGIYYSLLQVAGTFSAPVRITNQTAQLASRAIMYGGVPYVVAHYGLFNADGVATSEQPTDFLINQTGAVAAKILPGRAYYRSGSVPTLYNVTLTLRGLSNLIPTTSSDILEFATVFIFSGAILSQDSSGDVSQLSESGLGGIGLSKIEFDTTTTSSSMANNLALSGGYISTYDGSTVVEQGFHLFPEQITMSAGATTPPGSGTIPTGNYSATCVFSWIDEKGQIQRSAPAIPTPPIAITLGQQFGISVPPLTFTSKTTANTPVMIEFYITDTNGTVYYALNSSSGETGNINVPNATASTFSFIYYTQITDRVLYTTGGVVENIAPPSTKLMTSYKNRLITVPSEEPLTWWYSKQVVPGQPVEFSDLFVNNIDQRGGNVTALGAMDDKIVFFKESSIFYVAGDGPADTGANNTFTEAQLVTSDTGCTENKSVVTTPMGLMYKSAKGIYLLRRDLGVEFIGSDVVDYNSSVITSAQLLAKTNRVVFTLDSGVFLVFDYYVKQWSVYTPLNAVDSCIYKEDLAFIKSDGSVHLQTTGYTDDDVHVRLKLVTSWLSFAQLQGFQRIYKFLILGEYESPHTLNVSLAYEFDDDNVQTIDIPVTSEVVPYQFRVFPQIQKCETMRITIQDTQSATLGEGYAISALMLEVGAKQGTYKLSASRSYG